MEKPINLLGMIMSHMVDQMNRKSGSLSYGMFLTILFENAEIDFTNKFSQRLIHSDTYNKKSLRRMKFVKVENKWIHRESQTRTSNITKEELKEEWIPSDIPEIPEQAYTSIDEPSTSLNAANNTNDNTSIHPILTHDALVKVIESVVNIVKDQPLKAIVNSTLTEMVQTEVFKNNYSQLHLLQLLLEQENLN